MVAEFFFFRGSLSPAELDRYQHQLQEPQWGTEAQEQLKAARVVILTLSGLTLAAAANLIHAGLGRLRLVETRKVTLADLGGIFRETDLHKSKVKTAQHRLQEANPFATVEAFERQPNPRNLGELLTGVQLVISDLNHTPPWPVLGPAIWKQGLPWLWGGLAGQRGYLTLLHPGLTACPQCAGLQAGFAPAPLHLTPMAAVIGGLLAYEAMTFLGRQETRCLGRLFFLDFAAGNCGYQDLPRSRADCPVCREHHPPAASQETASVA